MASSGRTALVCLRALPARAPMLSQLSVATREDRPSPWESHQCFASLALRKNAELLGIQLATPASQRSARMRQAENTVPENRRFTSEIRRLGKAGRWEEARKIFRGADRKDTILYSALMTAADQCGRYRDGIELYKEMLAANLKPTAVTFVSLMNLHSHVGQREEVRQYFKELVALEGHPPPLAFMPLLTLASDSGDVAAAEAIFAEMESYGIRPDRGHFSAKLVACRSAADPDRAFAVLEEMKAKGMLLCTRVYTIAMGAIRASRLAERDFQEAYKKVSLLVADMEQRGVQKHEYFVEEHVGALLGCRFQEAEKRSFTEKFPTANVTAVLEVLREAQSANLRITRGLQAVQAALQRSSSTSPDVDLALAAVQPSAGNLAVAVPQVAAEMVWKEIWSSEHKRSYYWNTATGETSWTRPAI